MRLKRRNCLKGAAQDRAKQNMLKLLGMKATRGLTLFCSKACLDNKVNLVCMYSCPIYNQHSDINVGIRLVDTTIDYLGGVGLFHCSF